MQVKRKSFFKKSVEDITYFKEWVGCLEKLNMRKYESISVKTALGNTHVWGLHTDLDADTLVIFPGARTTALFWDLERGLDALGIPLRVFLVETNGLPNLSNGATPDIKSLDFGHWANEVFEQLNIEQAYVAGASFGGLITAKLGITNPEKIKAAFLLNPGCLQPFSMSFKNLYYNLLPLFKPTEKNVRTFLDKAVFCKPHHQLNPEYEQLVVDYEVFALKQYKDKSQKPYYMKGELSKVDVPVYLLEGTEDLLFPYKKSIANAKKFLPKLMEVKVYKNVGHGIETHQEAIRYIGERIHQLSK